MGTTVMIATPLEAELVEQVAACAPRLTVLYEPGLLPPPRFPCDHRGDPGFRRDPAGERRWRELLGLAEVLFGIPGDTPDGLALVAREHPGVRWVQATAAGAGEQLRAAGLTSAQLDRLLVTSAAGVHAGPLAEFCMLGLLAFAKGLPRLLADQGARRWGHYPMRELAGQSLLVVGLGQIGVEVARQARALGMRVTGVKRHPAAVEGVDAVHGPHELPALVGAADGVVITVPATDETRGLFGRELLARVRPGCVLVNVGRGAVVDEDAMVEALQDGRLAGAALDVFASEPPPPSSPLWGLPNVLLSPHTAALSRAENRRIVALFCDNLGRYLAGEPLRNLVDTVRFY